MGVLGRLLSHLGQSRLPGRIACRGGNGRDRLNARWVSMFHRRRSSGFGVRSSGRFAARRGDARREDHRDSPARGRPHAADRPRAEATQRRSVVSGLAGRRALGVDASTLSERSSLLLPGTLASRWRLELPANSTNNSMRTRSAPLGLCGGLQKRITLRPEVHPSRR